MSMEMYTLGLPQERQTLVRVNDERPPCMLAVGQEKYSSPTKSQRSLISLHGEGLLDVFSSFFSVDLLMIQSTTSREMIRASRLHWHTPVTLYSHL